MASQRAVSSADGRKMPPAIGDAVAPFGSQGKGGRTRDGAIYPAASRHNVSRLQQEPNPLQSECVHMGALVQQWSKNCLYTVGIVGGGGEWMFYSPLGSYVPLHAMYAHGGKR